MSWTPRNRGRHLIRAAALLLGLAAQLVLAQGVWALGPYSHLVLARSLAEPAWLDKPAVMAALYAGALAPDAGYYPGACDGLAEAAHLVRPWEVVRALNELAASEAERAFARGYLSHALLDRLGHEVLINRLSGRPFSVDPLEHKRVEWGLDCWWLSQPAGQWLRAVNADSPEGLDLWGRALTRAYGVKVAPEVLSQSLRAELKEVARLPTIFWLSGQAPRPGAWAGNSLGWILGHSLRPAAVGFMAWRGGYMNERAILGARRATPEDIAAQARLLELVEQATRQALQDGVLPSGNLDADPASQDPASEGVRQGQAWLDSLPKTP